jgi:hypothetical protein
VITVGLAERLRQLDARASDRLGRWHRGEVGAPPEWLGLVFHRRVLPEPVLSRRLRGFWFGRCVLAAVVFGVAFPVALVQGQFWFGLAALALCLGAAWLAYADVTTPLDYYPDRPDDE